MSYEIYKRTGPPMYPFLIIDNENCLMAGINTNGSMSQAAYTVLTPTILSEGYTESNFLELLVLCGLSKDQVAERFGKYLNEDDKDSA